MKKKVLILVLIYSMFLLFPEVVIAHPGKTDSSGCHYCRKNCAKWGLKNNEYHCHNGSSSNSNKSTTKSNSKSSKSKNKASNNSKKNSSTNKKSDNANLGSLKIDGKNISISDRMNFTTTNSMPNIVGTPANSKATLKIDKPSQLSRSSSNEIKITIVAENSKTKEYKLFINLVSNDATLKSLKVKNNEIEINDEMFFSTTDSKIELSVITNDEKAKAMYDKDCNLKIGDNKIKIKVTAEDEKTTKEYTLNVKRKVVLSDNVRIIVFVNGEKIKFNNYKSETIYISSDTNIIDIEYELEDDKSSVDLKYDKKINVGDKTIKFNVIAENGKIQEYILNFHRYSKLEETVYSIIGFAFIGGIGYGIYYFIKQRKRK